MNQYKKIIYFFILSLLVVVLQFSFFNTLSFSLFRINLALFLVIWYFIFKDFNSSVLLALFLGLFLDLFSFSFFGAYIISFLLTLIIAKLAWNNLFTNRSVYSFSLMTVIFALFFNLFLYLFIFLGESSFFGLWWFNKFFWFNLLVEIFYLNLGIIISFYLIGSKQSFRGTLVFDKNKF
ncbi:MAG: hypothetical protein ACOXZ1_01260 [Patescibacteria group bacterium]|jgi:rod shape-determining protein MreD